MVLLGNDVDPEKIFSHLGLGRTNVVPEPLHRFAIATEICFLTGADATEAGLQWLAERKEHGCKGLREAIGRHCALERLFHMCSELGITSGNQLLHDGVGERSRRGFIYRSGRTELSRMAR